MELINNFSTKVCGKNGSKSIAMAELRKPEFGQRMRAMDK